MEKQELMTDHELVFDEELLEDLAPPGLDDLALTGVDLRLRTDKLKVGDVLAGRYRADRVFRESALAVTLEASHVQLGQKVCIKLLLADPRAYPEAVARFLRGARTAGRIQNEHVARILDVGTLESGAPYVVSEFLVGSDLRRVLGVREALPVPEAVDLILQAAEGLSEAHALGLPHRNLKPSNLFLARRPGEASVLKVLDFFVSDDPLSDTAINRSGTSSALRALAYLAPEQIRTPDAVDGRADIWALGAMLHEFLTGSLLFEASSTPGLLAAIAADEPTRVGALRQDVPAELESLVLRCVAKEREYRPQTVAELASALKPFSSSIGHAAVERISMISLRRTRSTRPPPLPGLGASVPPSRAIVHVPAKEEARPSRPPAPVGRVAITGLGFCAAAFAGAFLAVQLMQHTILEAGRLHGTEPPREVVASLSPALAAMPTATASSVSTAAVAPPPAAVPPAPAAPAPVAPSPRPAAAVAAAPRPKSAAPRAEAPAEEAPKAVAAAKAPAARAKDLFDDAN